jgi:hypothetical protein
MVRSWETIRNVRIDSGRDTTELASSMENK